MSFDEGQPGSESPGADEVDQAKAVDQQQTKEKGKARGDDATPPEPGGGKPREEGSG